MDNSSWCSRLTDNAICQGVAKYCHSLQSLALNGCKKLTDRSITALLTFCPNIASLSLAHLPFITNEVLQSMAPQLKKLSILSLNGCSNVADSSIRAISEHCTSLQSLSLFSLKITDEAVQCVAERCKDLVSLSISGCVKVTDKGAVKIMHLLKLQSLYLNGAKITDRSILLIALNCSSIRALSLNDCEMLTDKAIVGLSRFCTQIQSLSMNNCGVTAVGVKSLIDRLPDLRELSIKQCHLCILDGPGSDVECKATGGINATAIGSSVLEQINRRRIALMR